MAKKIYRDFLQGLQIVPKASTSNARMGDLEVLSSDGKLYYHNGSVNSAVVTEATFPAQLVGQTYSAVNGSAAAPSFTFDNSPTTGLYRIGADILGIAIAGSERARINATTLLMRGGIESGVASTTSGSLSIFTSAGANSFGVSMTSNTEARLSASGTSNMTFYTNSNENLKIESGGSVRTGASGAIITTNERFTSRYTDSTGVAANGATAIASELLSNVATPVTTASSYSGLVSFLTRTTTVSLTDTSETMSAARTGVTFNPSGATTYTHSGSQGISGLRISAPSNGGAGSLAISNYNSLYIAASSLNTGTTKYGIRIGAQSGATNNFAIATDTGIVSFGDTVQGISGTKTIPAYSFTAEPTSGFFRIGSANIGLSLLDTLRYDFAAGYLAQYGPASSIDTTPGNGSATLALAKNATTGEGALISYSSGGSNFLTFYTNSGGADAVERLRLTTGGDVEVRGGTFVVYHSALSANFTISRPSTGETRLVSSGASSMTFYTNGDERVNIDSSGNFKINGGQLRLEDPGVGTNTVRLQAPSGLAATYTLTLPVDDGTPNQFLITDGSGVLSWSSTSPGAGAYQTSGTRGSPNSITAAGGITSTADSRLLMFVEGASPTLGVTDITANPQISAGITVGQEILLIGRNNSAKILLQNGNGLSLSGDKLLGEDDTLSLVYDGSVWVEVK